jgi:hypothetical protein
LPLSYVHIFSFSCCCLSLRSRYSPPPHVTASLLGRNILLPLIFISFRSKYYPPITSSLSGPNIVLLLLLLGLY